MKTEQEHYDIIKCKEPSLICRDNTENAVAAIHVHSSNADTKSVMFECTESLFSAVIESEDAIVISMTNLLFDEPILILMCKDRPDGPIIN